MTIWTLIMIAVWVVVIYVAIKTKREGLWGLSALLLILSGAAMATERESGPKGLLGGMKPTQDMLTGQDPLETWKRGSEAGKYWVELLSKVKSRDLQLNQALKLHQERFPNDSGPSELNAPPSAADAFYGQ
jgi:hypothetical protein